MHDDDPTTEQQLRLTSQALLTEARRWRERCDAAARAYRALPADLGSPTAFGRTAAGARAAETCAAWSEQMLDQLLAASRTSRYLAHALVAAADDFAAVETATVLDLDDLAGRHVVDVDVPPPPPTHRPRDASAPLAGGPVRAR